MTIHLMNNDKRGFQLIQGISHLYNQASDNLRMPLTRKWTSFLPLHVPTEMGYLSLHLRLARRRWLSGVISRELGGVADMNRGWRCKSIVPRGLIDPHVSTCTATGSRALKLVQGIRLVRFGTRRSLDLALFVFLAGVVLVALLATPGAAGGAPERLFITMATTRLDHSVKGNCLWRCGGLMMCVGRLRSRRLFGGTKERCNDSESDETTK